MAYKVLGIVNTYGNPDFGPMTEHRAIASTSFLGRYAFIDFPLSNFTNSHINYFGVLCDNHIRSLSRHVGNGRAWTSNTKIGDFHVLYDEPTVSNPGYHTDVSSLLENAWYHKDIKPDYVIIVPANIIYHVDWNELVKEHADSGKKVTVLYSHEKGLKTTFLGSKKLTIGDGNKVVRAEVNHGEEEEGDISLSSFIMDYDMLLQLLEYAKGTSSFFHLGDVLSYMTPSVFVRARKVTGYVRDFDSLSHYLKYSLELLDEDVFFSLFTEDNIIYTKSYDTPPALYKNGSEVTNSYIANGCIIEGTVINSVLGRDVKVKKGAVIKNAVIGSGAYISENTVIENAIVDKEAQVLHIASVKGTLDDPMYIARGDIV